MVVFAYLILMVISQYKFLSVYTFEILFIFKQWGSISLESIREVRENKFLQAILILHILALCIYWEFISLLWFTVGEFFCFMQGEF